jgi:hypothetical protein
MRKLISIREDGDKSISLRRRMLQAGCFPALILGAGIPILIVGVVAFTRLPVSLNSSRLESLIGVSGFLLLLLNVLASQGLRIGATIMGSHAGASGRSSLHEQLRVIQRRLLPIQTSLTVLRLLTYLLFGFVALILALAYSRSVTARAPSEWGVEMGFLVGRVQGMLSTVSFGEAGVLALLIGVGIHSLMGPFLAVPYSAALGAVAGARTGTDGKPAALALSLRFGASLAGALAFLWGWALLLLVGLAIADTSNYPFMSPRLLAMMRSLMGVFTPVVSTSAAFTSVALYAFSQFMMARILAKVATEQQVNQKVSPKRTGRFAEILETVVPPDGREETSA